MYPQHFPTYANLNPNLDSTLYPINPSPSRIFGLN